MSIIIYQTSVSPPARSALMVVNILGIKAETREVTLPRRDHYSQEYLEKNPLHTVPILEEDDLVIADSHAIITYLVSKYGEEKHESMYPKDLKIRAIIDQMLYFDATILFPRLKTVIYSVVRGQGMSRQQIADIQEAYDVLEIYLSKNIFVAGNEFTVADISCVATLSSLDCVLPVDKKHVNVNRWWATLSNEKWYKEVNVPGLELFRSFIKQFLK
ncbi:glutathione S-transferase epsilon 2 isoform X1 [Bombyx mori]|uniref:glutathione S-transferase epsilon 2 isoform X1 n=1 Tax=Bombyx mori TaxID=7091 RepID=UPI00024B5ACC